MSEPYSVTARKTGIIERMQVYLGAPLVEVGDAVLEGEPLVSGRVESGLGSVRYVHASALVEARTYYELTVVSPAGIRGRAAKRPPYALGARNRQRAG